jgi:hypothetical protein
MQIDTRHIDHRIFNKFMSNLRWICRKQEQKCYKCQHADDRNQVVRIFGDRGDVDRDKCREEQEHCH